MKIWIDYDVKDFVDEKVYAALDACNGICDGCETTQDVCMIKPIDCPVKSAVEAMNGMVLVGTGVKRYKEIPGLQQ